MINQTEGVGDFRCY